MALLNSVFINATTIPDAWHQAVFNILEYGRPFKIDKGSYEGDYRLEFDYVYIHMTHPESRPFEPEIPTALGIPNPVSPGYILGDDPSFVGEPYINYIMTDNRKPNEDYTYGQRLVAAETKNGIFDQVQHVIDTFMKYGHRNNQMCLQVADPGDMLLVDPPCVTPDTMILTSSGYKTAEMIRLNDLVYTHLGNWKKVIKIYNRQYNGNINKINIKGFQTSLLLTPEHPVYSVKVEKCPWASTMICKPNCKKKISCYEKNNSSCPSVFNNYVNDWIEAKILKGGEHFCVLPKIKHTITSDEITYKHMWLYGIFLAEGDYIKKDGIRFNLGSHEFDLIEKIVDVMKKLYNLNPHYDRSGQGSCRIIFYSRKLTKTFIEMFGKGARNKTIPFQFVYLNKELLSELIEGYKDGDGYRARDEYYTSSKNIVDVLRLIYLKLGKIPYIRYVKPSNGGKINGREIKSNGGGYCISDFTSKKRYIDWTDENNLYAKISSNEVLEYDGLVYNFEIEDDNSYMANGIIVHNCLRHIDCRIQDDHLHFMPYFRSWDLWGGFPANLAGIQILKEYMASEIGVEPGETIVTSKGLHLYKFTWKLAEIRRQSGDIINKFLIDIGESTSE